MASVPNPVTTEVDARGKPAREINNEIRELMRRGEKSIHVRHAEAQHNLAVGILEQVTITFEGSVGYYCGGLIDGATLEVHGSAGWGLGESMLEGRIQVRGNAGNSCAASIRGGTVVVHGSTGARAGVSMKGGLLIIEGDCGYMTGFMMQKGRIVVCGNAGPALADSMYEGTVFVGGEIADLGNDAIIKAPDDDDWNFLHDNLGHWGISSERPFKKVVSGRRLWNFDKQDRELWKVAL